MEPTIPGRSPPGLSKRIEDDAGEELREEVGGLRRHRLARGGDLADLVDRGGAEQEGRLVIAGLESRQGLVDAWRVSDAALGGDVIRAHPKDSLEHHLL